jgi:Coatomer gamma subunit appendage platform subdomain
MIPRHLLKHLTPHRYPKSAERRLHKTLPVSFIISLTHNFIFLNTKVIGPSTLDTIGVPASTRISTTPPPPTAAETQSAYAQQLADVPELAGYGTVLNSTSKPVQLTETETEYQVTCVKHIFQEHVVFQVRLKPVCYSSTGANGVCSSMYRILCQTQC